MKRLLCMALLYGPVSALAADKPAPKTAAPAPAPKDEQHVMPKDSKDLKAEEPDQTDPKNKETDVKSQGEVKKEDF